MIQKIIIFLLIFNFEILRNAVVAEKKNNESKFEKWEAALENLQLNNFKIQNKLEKLEQKLNFLEANVAKLIENGKIIAANVNLELEQRAVPDCQALKAKNEESPEIIEHHVEQTVSYDEHFDCQNCKNLSGVHNTCSTALKLLKGGDGIYKLYLENSGLKPFNTFCMQDSYGDNAWIIVQRREFGDVNFSRNWTDYVKGFGNLVGDYWLGLERLHALTASRKHELWIQMKDHEGIGRYANYESIVVGNEAQNFRITELGEYVGDAGNSMAFNLDAEFSTYDKDNDSEMDINCAEKRKGGWWFRDCKHSNLNGVYNSTDYGSGVNWIGWHNYRYSLKYVHIAIRPLSLDLMKQNSYEDVSSEVSNKLYT